MSVDATTVKRIAHLARIKLADAECAPLAAELSNLVGWIEQLSEVDTTGVEPMTAVMPITLKWREDVVTDGQDTGGNVRDAVLSNAPAKGYGFFAVPKVIE